MTSVEILAMPFHARNHCENKIINNRDRKSEISVCVPKWLLANREITRYAFEHIPTQI